MSDSKARRSLPDTNIGKVQKKMAEVDWGMWPWPRAFLKARRFRGRRASHEGRGPSCSLTAIGAEGQVAMADDDSNAESICCENPSFRSPQTTLKTA